MADFSYNAHDMVRVIEALEHAGEQIHAVRNDYMQRTHNEVQRSVDLDEAWSTTVTDKLKEFQDTTTKRLDQLDKEVTATIHEIATIVEAVVSYSKAVEGNDGANAAMFTGISEAFGKDHKTMQDRMTDNEEGNIVDLTAIVNDRDKERAK